jgi:hypothetical protein
VRQEPLLPQLQNFDVSSGSSLASPSRTDHAVVAVDGMVGIGSRTIGRHLQFVT